MTHLKRLLIVLSILACLASCDTASQGDNQASRGADAEGSGQEVMPLERGEEGEEGAEEEGEVGGESGSGGDPGGGALEPTGRCTRCARRARLDFDPGQGESGWEGWVRCMAENMPYETMDPNDPAFEGALDACEEYEPEGGGEEVMYPSSVLSWLAQTATTSCFHMTTGLAEYEFRYSWETGLEGDTLPNGKPVVSAFALLLEFRGEPQEIIKTWLTESSVETVTSHYSRMFENSDAELRKDLPLEEMLWRFEKTPESCEIEPDEDEVEPEEKIEVELSDCVTSEGEGSREFNRLLVVADEGTIHGGTPAEINPHMHVFVLGDGKITFTYEAPDSTEHEDDTIRVYSSCEILTPKEQPLEGTLPHEQIAIRTIRIKRPTGWTGTITASRQDGDSFSEAYGFSSMEGSWSAAEDISVEFSLQYDHANMTGPGDVFSGTTDGTYSLSFERNEEHYNKGELFYTQLQSIRCAGALDPAYNSVLLTWDKQEGTYELAVFISTPVCQGTKEIRLIDGTTMTSEIYSTQHFLGEGGAFYWSGTTDGTTITGTESTALKDWSYSLEYQGE